MFKTPMVSRDVMGQRDCSVRAAAASQLCKLTAPVSILDEAWGQGPGVGARKGTTSGAGGHQRTLMTSQPQASRRQDWQDLEQLLPSPALERLLVNRPPSWWFLPSQRQLESRGPRTQQARGQFLSYLPCTG